MRQSDPRLTEKVLRALVTLTATQGYPPSLSQMAGVVGATKTRVFSTLRREEAAGRVTHDPGVSRSWRVVEPTPA